MNGLQQAASHQPVKEKPRARATTLAGANVRGHDGDLGPAAQASLDSPFALMRDADGHLLFSDSGNHCIRVIARADGQCFGLTVHAGYIHTLAGASDPGCDGDGEHATAARLNAPRGLALDDMGNLLIADSGNHRIRCIARHDGLHYGQAMRAGCIYTLAGGDGDADCGIGDDGIAGIGDGGIAARALLHKPQALAVDAHGNLLIADSGHHRIRCIARRDGTHYGVPMRAGCIHTVAGSTRGKRDDDGEPATAAQLNMPFGLAVDDDGNLLIADTVNHRIRIVPNVPGRHYGLDLQAGAIGTLAGAGFGHEGDGGPSTQARLGFPRGLAVDEAGQVLVADWDNHRIRCIARRDGTHYGTAMRAGHIYAIAQAMTDAASKDDLIRATLRFPSGMLPDGPTGLLVVDTDNHCIRRLWY